MKSNDVFLVESNQTLKFIYNGDSPLKLQVQRFTLSLNVKFLALKSRIWIRNYIDSYWFQLGDLLISIFTYLLFGIIWFMLEKYIRDFLNVYNNHDEAYHGISPFLKIFLFMLEE